MKRIIALSTAATSLAFAAEPPAKDRQAILSMAGTHAVTFEFRDGVRNFRTESGEKAPASFTYSTHQNGEGLSKLIERLEQEKPEPKAAAAALQAYCVSK